MKYSLPIGGGGDKLKKRGKVQRIKVLVIIKILNLRPWPSNMTVTNPKAVRFHRTVYADHCLKQFYNCLHKVKNLYLLEYV